MNEVGSRLDGADRGAVPCSRPQEFEDGETVRRDAERSPCRSAGRLGALLRTVGRNSARAGRVARYRSGDQRSGRLPVESVLILLRPKALASDQTGLYSRRGVTGSIIADFRYRLERVWERSVDSWLNGGLGLAPLALLTDEADADLENALDRFRTCLRDYKADEATAKSILGSSYVLCGLRYERARIAEMYRRLSMLMEDSTTYQEIMEKGQFQAYRKLILRQGTKRFGSPAPTVTASLGQITDLNRLEQLAERMLDATSWDDLLRPE